MNQRNERDAQRDAQEGDAQARIAAMQRRRRFMKIGASAVPVSLSLASRPVMAWHCNTTSAWGSAILLNGVASVKARAAAAQINGTECWYLANWMNNNCSNTSMTTNPWAACGKKVYSGMSLTNDAAWSTQAQGNLKISAIFPSGLFGVSGSKKVFAYLTDPANAGDYRCYIIAARLNQLYAPNPAVAQCTISSSTAGNKDMTLEMARLGAGSFTVSGRAWTAKDIKDYLTGNYLA